MVQARARREITPEPAEPRAPNTSWRSAGCEVARGRRRGRKPVTENVGPQSKATHSLRKVDLEPEKAERGKKRSRENAKLVTQVCL